MRVRPFMSFELHLSSNVMERGRSPTELPGGIYFGRIPHSTQDLILNNERFPGLRCEQIESNKIIKISRLNSIIY